MMRIFAGAGFARVCMEEQWTPRQAWHPPLSVHAGLVCPLASKSAPRACWPGVGGSVGLLWRDVEVLRRSGRLRRLREVRSEPAEPACLCV